MPTTIVTTLQGTPPRRKSELFRFRGFVLLAEFLRMASFRRVCGIADIEEGRGLALELDGLRVAVFRVGDRYHAISGRCPHANGALGLGWIEDGEAVCPLHRWRFRLDTGRCTTVRGESVHPFACEVRGADVYVAV